jgi:hypothetical protein
MKRHRFEVILGAGLAALYLAFSAWYSSWGGKLTREEIDHYLSIIETLPHPQEGDREITARIRAWAEADDGRPVYMCNLIRFYPQVRAFPGAPEFAGTPQEANAHYERSLRWLWLSRASYPTFSGDTQARNLVNMRPEREWGKVMLVRYPSRRTFLKLLSDPAYAPVEPYKFIAAELDLVPVSGEVVLPDPRWLLGGSLAITFLLVGWVRAARSRSRAPPPASM